VQQVASKYDIPILGQGGITTADDAIDFAIVGSSAIGVGTGLFYDPLLCSTLLEGMADYLHQHQFACWQDLVATLQT